MAVPLVLSVLALATGLGIFVAGRDRPLLRLTVEGFVVGVVPTLVAVHILPQLWSHVGVVAPGAVATGYAVFWLIEHAVEHQKIHSPVVVSVLALHSLLDGASLAVAQRLDLGGASGILIAAIVLHRIPEGLVVGALLTAPHGLKAAASGAAVLAVMTLAGAAGGRELLHCVEGLWLNVVIAGGMGALLRAVLHGHGSPRLRATPGLVGALVGAAMAVAVPELP